MSKYVQVMYPSKLSWSLRNAIGNFALSWSQHEATLLSAESRGTASLLRSLLRSALSLAHLAELAAAGAVAGRRGHGQRSLIILIVVANGTGGGNGRLGRGGRGTVARRGGDGAVTRRGRRQVRAAGGLLGQGGPRLVVGGAGGAKVRAVQAKACAVHVEGALGVGRVGDLVGAEGPAEDGRLVIGGEGGCVAGDAALADESPRERVLPDDGASRDGLEGQARVGDDGRVGVASGLTEGGNDLVAVGPGNEEQAADHVATKGNGDIALADGGGDTADKVGGGLGGEGNTKLDPGALVDVVLEGDAGRLVDEVNSLLGRDGGGHETGRKEGLEHVVGCWILKTGPFGGRMMMKVIVKGFRQGVLK